MSAVVLCGGVWLGSVDELVGFIARHGITSVHITECFTDRRRPATTTLHPPHHHLSSSAAAAAVHYIYLHSHLEWTSSCLPQHHSSTHSQLCTSKDGGIGGCDHDNDMSPPPPPQCPHVLSYATTIIFVLRQNNSSTRCAPQPVSTTTDRGNDDGGPAVLSPSFFRLLELKLSVASLFAVGSGKLESFCVDSTHFGSREWVRSNDGVLGSSIASVVSSSYPPSSSTINSSTAGAASAFSVACVHGANLPPIWLTEAQFLTLWPATLWRKAFAACPSCEGPPVDQRIAAMCDAAVQSGDGHHHPHGRSHHTSSSVFTSSLVVRQFIDFLATHSKHSSQQSIATVPINSQRVIDTTTTSAAATATQQQQQSQLRPPTTAAAGSQPQPSTAAVDQSSSAYLTSAIADFAAALRKRRRSTATKQQTTAATSCSPATGGGEVLRPSVSSIGLIVCIDGVVASQQTMLSAAVGLHRSVGHLISSVDPKLLHGCCGSQADANVVLPPCSLSSVVETCCGVGADGCVTMVPIMVTRPAPAASSSSSNNNCNLENLPMPNPQHQGCSGSLCFIVNFTRSGLEWAGVNSSVAPPSVACAVSKCCESALRQLRSDHPDLFLTHGERREEAKSVLVASIAGAVAAMVEIAPSCGPFARELAAALRLPSPLSSQAVRSQTIAILSALPAL